MAISFRIRNFKTKKRDLLCSEKFEKELGLIYREKKHGIHLAKKARFSNGTYMDKKKKNVLVQLDLLTHSPRITKKTFSLSIAWRLRTLTTTNKHRRQLTPPIKNPSSAPSPSPSQPMNTNSPSPPTNASPTPSPGDGLLH